MGKLDLNIWNIDASNDAIFWGAVQDLTQWAKDSAQSLLNLGAPHAKNLAENTAYVSRHWGKNGIFNLSNWGKLARTPLVVGADLAMKAKSLPFKALDKATQYLFLNNLERLVGWAKSVTTWAAENWITSNGQTNSKTAKVIWNTIGGIGDIIWSGIKVIPGLVWLATNKLSQHVWDLGIPATNQWTKDLRVSNDDIFNQPVLQNSWDTWISNVVPVDFGNRKSDTGDLKIAA